MSTKTKPEGGALSLILEKWIQGVESKVVSEGMTPSDPGFASAVEKKIYEVIYSMNEMVHGFDFAKLLSLYFQSYMAGDEEGKAKVLKWFRGEYATKTEARKDLGVTIIITDDDWYEYMKLFAVFFHQAGYAGMMIMIDELVNIYRIPNAITRQNNYEKILTMYNDTMQGKAQYLGFLMCGTPQCIEDTRRGVYSYEALRSRLQEGRFSRDGVRDLLGPVIRLEPLTAEEMLVLCGKLTDIHAQLYGYQAKLTDQDLATFIQIEYSRIGANTHITPREVIRDFIEVLDILYQDPKMSVKELLNSDSFEFAKDELSEQEDDAAKTIAAEPAQEKRDFSSFSL